MDNIITLTIALYGAVLSTVVFIFELYKYFGNRPKLSLFLFYGSYGKTLEEMELNYSKGNRFLIVSLTNHGKEKMVISGPFGVNKESKKVLLCIGDNIKLDVGENTSIQLPTSLILKRNKIWFEDSSLKRFYVSRKEIKKSRSAIMEHLVVNE
jgi:hypothetical protein